MKIYCNVVWTAAKGELTYQKIPPFHHPHPLHTHTFYKGSNYVASFLLSCILISFGKVIYSESEDFVSQEQILCFFSILLMARQKHLRVVIPETPSFLFKKSMFIHLLIYSMYEICVLREIIHDVSQTVALFQFWNFKKMADTQEIIVLVIIVSLFKRAL